MTTAVPKAPPSAARKLVSAVLAVVLFVPKKLFRWFDEAFLSYIRMRVIYVEEDRPSSIRYVHYSKWLFAYLLVLGSLAVEGLLRGHALSAGWSVFVWLTMVVVVIYAMVDKMSWQKFGILGLVVLLLLVSNALGNLRYGWNIFAHIKEHIQSLEAIASPGFFRLAAYLFLLMMSGSIVWAWLMNRVEQGADYIVMVRFLSRTGREPTFAAPITRDHSDLAEVLLANSANLEIRTRNLGTLFLPNVPMMAYGPKARAMDELCRPRTHEETVAEQRQAGGDQEMMPAQLHHRDEGHEHDHGDMHEHDHHNGHDHVQASDDIRAPG